MKRNVSGHAMQSRGMSDSLVEIARADHVWPGRGVASLADYLKTNRSKLVECRMISVLALWLDRVNYWIEVEGGAIFHAR